MRMMTFIIGLVLSSGAAAGDVQQGPAAPVLRVGVFGYDADGSSPMAAWDTPPSTNSVVSIKSLCMVAAGPRPHAEATDAWRFSGKVLSLTADEAVVELEWQRIVDRGQAVTAPSGNVQLTLRAGENVVLDRVVPDAPSQCSITAASFEARYGSYPSRTGVRGKAEGGSGSVAVGGRGTSPHASGGASVSERIRAFTVNLWFVRSAPGQPDEVLHQPILATNRGGEFAFAPVNIDAPGGAIVVHVTGSFSISHDTNGEQLLFVMNRRVTSARSQTTRDRPPDAHGTSRTTIPLPGPDEVVSFEMPPIVMNGQPLVPDKFSVRVRITPR